MLELNRIHQGDSWELAKQLVDNSVDCVVTSPPYWGLRDYGVVGQAGLEEHPQVWVDKMVELFQLLKPKIKNTGTVWVNVGESYYAGSNKSAWLQPKQLLGLPWRFAIAMQGNPTGWEEAELRKDLTQAQKEFVFKELIHRGLI